MITRKRRLDDLLTPAEQEQWLKNPASFNRADEEEDMRRLQIFEDHPASSDCLSLLTKFALYCLPIPARTERSFWSVSCIPSTNQRHRPRLACVSLSVMEVFVLGYHLKERDRVWGRINVSKQKFREHYPSNETFRLRHPKIGIEDDRYDHPGPDCLSLPADDLEPLHHLPSDEAILAASAALNLRLMQLRPTIYSQYHSPALSKTRCKCE